MVKSQNKAFNLSVLERYIKEFGLKAENNISGINATLDDKGNINITHSAGETQIKMGYLQRLAEERGWTQKTKPPVKGGGNVCSTIRCGG